MEMSIFLIILKAKQGILTFSLLQFSGCNSTVESTWINCRKEVHKIATSPRNRLIANQSSLSIHFLPTRCVKKYRKHCFGKYFLNILLFKLKQLEKFARTFFFSSYAVGWLWNVKDLEKDWRFFGVLSMEVS